MTAFQEFAELVAVVTGGASGIGAATARALASRGATVVALDRAGASLNGVEMRECDVTHDASVREASDRCGAGPWRDRCPGQ